MITTPQYQFLGVLGWSRQLFVPVRGGGGGSGDD